MEQQQDNRRSAGITGGVGITAASLEHLPKTDAVQIPKDDPIHKTLASLRTGVKRGQGLTGDPREQEQESEQRLSGQEPPGQKPWDPERQKANEEAAQLRKENEELRKLVEQAQPGGGTPGGLTLPEGVELPELKEVKLPDKPDNLSTPDEVEEYERAVAHNDMVKYLKTLTGAINMGKASTAYGKLIDKAVTEIAGEENRNELRTRVATRLKAEGFTDSQPPDAKATAGYVEAEALKLAIEKGGNSGQPVRKPANTIAPDTGQGGSPAPAKVERYIGMSGAERRKALVAEGRIGKHWA